MRLILLAIGITVSTFPALTFALNDSSKETAAEPRYANPIIAGMNPDPSICRDGEDYYLITSSFEFFPGIPIYHSRDLVHWRLIGHGLTKPSQLNLAGNESLNIYAATIRYHQGTFYIITTCVGKKGDRNFVITATDPAGPWSEAHWIPEADRIDPSLFFDDDGKVYYTGNTTKKDQLKTKWRQIWTQEIDPETWTLIGKRVDVLMTKDYFEELNLAESDQYLLNFFEGPHLYKKDGSYYLMLSHGGTFWDHAVAIWKSDQVFGPYEACPRNPILTHRDLPHTHPIHHTGHADLVQTQNGEWWMVLLGCRPYGGEFTNLGRETFLVPVAWSDIWPIVNPDGQTGRVEEFHRTPNLQTHPWPAENRRDEFDGDKLNPYWYMIKIAQTTWWSLDNPTGKLRIKLRPEIIEATVNPSFIGRKQVDKSFIATTTMAFTPKADYETAGLVITRDTGNCFQVLSKLKDGRQYVQLVRRNSVKNEETIVAEKPVSGTTLYLQIKAQEQQFSFCFSEDGTHWITLADHVDGSMLGEATGTGRFTGTFIGMYASSNGKKCDNSALFDWFEYEGL